MTRRGKIVGTTAVRVFIAVLNMYIVVLNARHLGAAGVGAIAIFLLVLHLGLLLCEWLAGSALVYLAPRLKTSTLLLPAFFWVTLIALLTWLALRTFGSSYFSAFQIHVLGILLWIQGFNQALLHVAVGQKRITAYNMLTLLPPIVMVVGLSLTYLLQSSKASVDAYYLLLLLAQIPVLPSAFYSIGHYREASGKIAEALRQMGNLGFFVQLANVIQFMNYRLIYLLVEKFLGLTSLGIYTVGNQISEAVWMPGRSAALVHYSETSQMKVEQKRIVATLGMLRYTGMVTALALMAVFIIPEFIFASIFGTDFAASKPVFVYLLPGIFMFALTFPISAYFAGKGLQKINAFISLSGFALLLVFGFASIPDGDLITVCRVVSISYGMQSLLAVVLFLKFTGISWKRLFLRDEHNGLE